jgi:hypothetical protein
VSRARIIIALSDASNGRQQFKEWLWQFVEWLLFKIAAAAADGHRYLKSLVWMAH